MVDRFRLVWLPSVSPLFPHWVTSVMSCDSHRSFVLRHGKGSAAKQRTCGAASIPTSLQTLFAALSRTRRRAVTSTRLRTALYRCARERACKAFQRSEEHTSELQSLMRNSYAVFCLKKKK